MSEGRDKEIAQAIKSEIIARIFNLSPGGIETIVEKVTYELPGFGEVSIHGRLVSFNKDGRNTLEFKLSGKEVCEKIGKIIKGIQ